MTNHKARKKLANQKWIHRSVYPCGISEQAFGSSFADELYRGFYDKSGCIAGYPYDPTSKFYTILLDEVFVISGIIKVEVSVISRRLITLNRDLDYFGYHKNRI